MSDDQDKYKRRARPTDAIGAVFDGLTGLTAYALNEAVKTSGKALQALQRTPEQLRQLAQAGESLRDLRELAGYSLTELSDALQLGDKSLLEAVEEGKAALPFEIILRLSSILARNDPLPFILKYTRTYNPKLSEFLQDWGLGKLPLQYEREREFINIYRKHDIARDLSDEDYAKVLAFVDSSFDMAMQLVADKQAESEDDEEYDNDSE
jgi:transcriptional regulator with XRE-family HTH domain